MSISISLGAVCQSAIYGVEHNLRPLKSEGYNTCPFDMMMTPYDGLIDCLENDFEGFTSSDNLILFDVGTEYYIKNTKYGFYFNHESPGHANLYLTENWPGGKNHFVDNDFQKFKERYDKRINNFRNYLNSGLKIYFILDVPGNREHSYEKLHTVLKNKYPSLVYELIIIKTHDCQITYDIFGFKNEF